MLILLFLGIMGSMVIFLPKKLWGAHFLILFIKLLLVVSVSTVVSLHRYPGSLLPGNPDQFWYVETAQRIAVELRSKNFLDYYEIVNIHNRLYNILLGWITYLNGNSSVLLYRMFNTMISIAIAIIGYHFSISIYPNQRLYHTFAYIFLSFLPSLNIYSQFVLRDILISFVNILFFYLLWIRKWAILPIVIYIMYYLRLQMSYIYIASLLIYATILIFKSLHFESKKHKKYILILEIFIVMTLISYLLSLFFKVDYLFQYIFKFDFWKIIIRFPFSFLGLDFLIADESKSYFSRSILLLSRLLMIDGFILPLIYIFTVYRYFKVRNFDLINFINILSFIMMSYYIGYSIEYNVTFLRLWIPFYPILLLMILPSLKNIVFKYFYAILNFKRYII
uniref:Glycosyltransferase RgtA/B/C/D-like domain-containing protein n=1 Tax=Dictyoglomus thermophilum TaxID=14 RepID=A0A7C3RJI0_DICTH